MAFIGILREHLFKLSFGLMRELVASFPRQLREALEIGKSANLKPAERSIANLVIIGLGGSGIGGTVVGEILFDQSPVPIQPIKDYQVPN